MPGRAKPLLLLGALFLALHLNYWMWDDSRLVLGFPINLLYHIALSLSVSAAMLAMVKLGTRSS